ncbi:MAG: VOC family protein [Ardenticatenaceae bacterium]|nr:VOC family protein [Ardenticatenaceae bacterium]
MEAIHAQTHIGLVSLTVSNLRRSLTFYTQNIGLKLLSLEEQSAVLGTAERPLLHLVEQPGATHVANATGLYHFALLLPSRVDLARSLKHMVQTETPLGGFSDHSVSEAIYLSDPDGNGIEIYRDRKRQEWPIQNGRLEMDTRPLDLQGLMGELNGRTPAWDGMPAGTQMGHIHLHIRDVDEAERFYCDVLGFDRIMRYGPSAAFVSAGGYHHHIGLNTWAGRGAPPPPAGSVGLRHYLILLPTQEALAAVKARLEANNISYEEKDGVIALHDPSQNHIHLQVAT